MAISLYNVVRYNTALYGSAIAWLLSLSDSQVQTESYIFGDSHVLAGEAQTLVVAVQNFLDRLLQAEAVSLGEPIVRNPSLYNTAMYNVTGYGQGSIGFTKVVTKAAAEALSLSAALGAFLAAKNLSETTSLTVAEFVSFLAPRNDFIFLTETFKREFTNKALGDSVSVQTWLELRKSGDSIWTSSQ